MRGQAHKDSRSSAQALARLYETWNAAQPDEKHAAAALDWKAKAESGR